jgi:hemerythrin-like domain-containing protein
MIKDHNKIEKLINQLEEKNNEDFKSMKKAFNNFEWELEKHIFTEEKAIFTSYTPENINEGYKMLPELTKQHNFILNKLNNWRKDIRNKNMISDIYSFKIYIIRHKNFEEEKVYPMLDQSLTEEEKRHIESKINEIVQK